jgi:DNA-binding transcriptional LysR family regulator
MPDNRLRIAYARGVTPGKWVRIWGERFPRVPLELTQLDAVTDAPAELARLRDGSADLAFVRLRPGDDDAAALDGLHLIPLYEERPFVVAPKGNVVEAADEVTIAELGGEHRHPFDDDIATTIEVVAANVGVVIVPQSIARLYARKDVVARPVADAPGWRVGLAWPRESAAQRLIDDFIGVVRGRTANSSRGARGASDAKPASAGKQKQQPKQQPTARSARAGRSRRRPTR